MVPQKFYKYMSVATAKIVLSNQTLRWSTPETLNDPYDIQFDLRVDIDREVVRQRAIVKLWDNYNRSHGVIDTNSLGVLIEMLRVVEPGIEKNEFLRRFTPGIDEALGGIDALVAKARSEARKKLKRTKILCLTDTPDNQLMWAYYSDSNRGAVLSFRNVPGEDSPYVGAVPVKYAEDIPLLFDNESLSDLLSGSSVRASKELVHDSVYTKSEVWKHEREWRIVAGDGRFPEKPFEDIKFGGGELESIIFGCRMEQSDRDALRGIIERKYPGAAIYQACPQGNTYKLRFERVDFL